MNAKKCKQLRRIAREHTVGAANSNTVASTQQVTPRLGKDGKTVHPYRECSVNEPGTTRALYREGKSGRQISRTPIIKAEHRAKRVAMEKEAAEAAAKLKAEIGGGDTTLPVSDHTITPEPGTMARLKESIRLGFRRFSR